MGRTLLFAAVVAILLAAIFAGSALAAPIGINLVGDDPAKSDKVGDAEAGVESQTYWNDVQYWEGSGLVNADGDGTSVDADIGTSGRAYNSWIPIPSGAVPGDNLLMRGYLHQNGSPWSIVLSNLVSAYGSDGYDLIVYCDGENGSSDWVTEYAVASGGTPLASIFAKDVTDTVAWDGVFVEATGTNAADATEGNYVRFRGLTADSLTLTATPESGNAPINGLQLIPVPEPATLGLLLVGLLGACFRKR